MMSNDLTTTYLIPTPTKEWQIWEFKNGGIDKRPNKFIIEHKRKN